MKKSFLFICFLIPLLSSIIYAKSYDVKILKQSSTEIILEVQFNKPVQSQINTQDNYSPIFQIDGLLLSDKIGEFVVPFLSKQFSLSGANLNSEILKIETGSIKIQNYLNNENSKNYSIKKSNNNFQYYSVELNGVF